MARVTLGNEALPDGAVTALRILGSNIDVARKRRKLTQAEMAAHMFVTVKTLRRVLAGDSGVGIGVYASALHVLGLADQLTMLASQESDAVGNWQERKSLPKRIRKVEDKDLDF